MQKLYKYLSAHFFFYFIVGFVFVVGLSSYYRFMVKHDYNVSYNGLCDQTTEKCFKNYEGDAGTELTYYSKMEKYAPDLYKECGDDITNCKEASVCLLSDRNCSKTYCDKDVAGNDCSTPITLNNNATSTKK